MGEREKIYDELSDLLTEYEEARMVLRSHSNWERELYNMLVKIQNNWETVITAANV